MNEFMKDVEKILEDILKLERGSMHNFDRTIKLQELGLDSIALIGFIVSIEDKFGISIRDDDLLNDKWNTMEDIENRLRMYLCFN